MLRHSGGCPPATDGVPSDVVTGVDSLMRKSSSMANVRSLPGLLTPSYAYKPFRYPWAYDFWKRQQQVHWMPEEVPLGEDCKDWATKLNDRERHLLTQIF